MKPFIVALIPLALIAACSRESQPAAANSKSPSSSKSASKTHAAEAAPAPGATEVGDSMPPYRGKLLDGTDFQLSAQKGKVVLLNVWATWCGPCRFEIPELEALDRKYAANGLKVIGVSVDEGGDEAVKQFVAEQKMTYAVGVDPDGRIANLLQTTVLPTSVLIDRSGKIVWRQVGALSPEDAKLHQALEAALGGKKI